MPATTPPAAIRSSVGEHRGGSGVLALVGEEGQRLGEAGIGVVARAKLLDELSAA